MLKNILPRLRENSPLIHSITNVVTVNDCANALLAVGASPIMSDDREEVAEIVSLAQGLIINIGTLNARTIDSMLIAGKRANELGIPVLLDPVGCGASSLRRKTVQALLSAISFTAIRGNLSELKALYLGSHSSRGVDADSSDIITAESSASIIELAQKASALTKSLIVISGAIDIIASPLGEAALVYNGVSMMSRVTGTGCISTALLGAFLAGSNSAPFPAAVAATCSMGVAGELARSRLKSLDGSGSYRTYLIDALYNLDENLLISKARYEIR